MLDDRTAATLIRQVVAGELGEAELREAWPKSASGTEDLRNARASVIELFSSRHQSDAAMTDALAGDLTDVAKALESGKKITWYSVEPRWHWLGFGVAAAVGLLLWSVADRLAAPQWVGRAGFWVCILGYWLIEWRWAVREVDRREPEAS